MARVDDLLRRVSDPGLRAELTSAIAEVRRTKDFGLVYESHLPETCRLPSHPVRRGVKVAVRSSTDDAMFTVLSVDGDTAKTLPIRDADGIAVDAEAQVPIEQALDELVVVAEFGDPIYPGLRSVGSVRRGGDKPAHVVINAENHHALEALQFTHAGKVDCVYIDPPYNSGARDWKYNNDYVDDGDRYRHSKWLAMMERRLRLAKELLNPHDSILIVAIDEKEYLRLGLLLEQVFAGSDTQMVSVVTHRAGSPRAGRFARFDEYLFYVFVGKAEVSRWTSSMLNDDPAERSMPNVWFSAARVGTGSALRSARPALFYPVLLDAETGALHSVGEALAPEEERIEYSTPAGTVAIWPLSSEGREQTWRFSRERMIEYFAAGTARLGKRDETTGLRPITYLRPGTIKNIDEGVFEVRGRSEGGALELGLAGGTGPTVAPGSVWARTAHYARDYGSKLNSQLIPGRSFPYPKSLYAVEDSLRFAVGSKPDAVVLDYFAGSGTTTHAVARVNRQDGGRRQSISITNNEVSADEASRLTRSGHQQGDPEWETLGIFEHITRPRIEAAVTGRTPDGDPIRGDYKFVDEFPMADGFEENVEFFELTYQDAARVELDLVFKAVAPLLWMRAGGQGDVIKQHTDEGWAWADRYGVLWDVDAWQAFIANAPDSAVMAFVVTDSDAQFSSIVAELPVGVEAVHLYERYLSTFAINTGM